MTKEADKELLADLTTINIAVAYLYHKYFSGEIKLNPVINKKAFERYLKRLSDEARKIKSNTIVCLAKQFEKEGELAIDNVPLVETPYQTKIFPPDDLQKEDW